MEPTQPYVILAAVDYSPSGDLALERAAELAAEKRSAALHVVNVLPVYQAGFAAGEDSERAGAWVRRLPTVSEAANELRAYTERMLEGFRKAHPNAELGFLDQVGVHQRVDVPSEEVAQLAADLEADLVVVGTHGRRGLSRLLLGSVAEATVRLAPCPVLVVRPKALPQPTVAIQPPCPNCLETRRATGGKELWCEQHRAHHGQRHTYHQGDRKAEETNLPLVFR